MGIQVSSGHRCIAETADNDHKNEAARSPVWPMENQSDGNRNPSDIKLEAEQIAVDSIFLIQ